MKTVRRFGRWAIVLTVLATPNAFGQGSFLERLQTTVKEGVEAISKPAPQPPTDEAPQPYLGLTVDNAGEGEKGIRVIAVRTGGPASTAGIMPGDIVAAVGDNPIRTMEEMATVLGAMRPGDRLVFQLERNGRAVTIPVVVARKAGSRPAPAKQPLPPPDPQPADGAAPSATSPLPPPEPSPAEAQPTPARPLIGAGAETLPQRPGAPTLGITVSSITEEAQVRHGLTLRKGALVTAVKPGSPCAPAGVPVGAAITALDGRPIDSPLALVQALRQTRVGQEVELSYYAGSELRRCKVNLAEGPPLRPLQTPSAPPAKKPILDRVEGLIDRFVRPKESPPPPPTATAEPAETPESLRAEIDRLRRQLSDMERRLKEMEK